MSFLYFFWGFMCQWILKAVVSPFSEVTGAWIESVPSLIGYTIFFIGFLKMQSKNPMFAKAKIPALALMALSVVQMFIPSDTITIGTYPTMIVLFGIILTILVIVPELYMIYYLCKGIEQMADDQLFPDLREIAKKRWKLFVYCQFSIALVLIVSLIAAFTQLEAFALVVGLLSLFYIIFNLIVYILLLTLTWKAHKSLSLTTEPFQES